jgi:cell division protein FtsL
MKMAKTVAFGADRVLWIDGGAKTKSASKRAPLLFLALLMFFLIGGGLFYVWSRIQAIQFGYEISNAIKAGRGLSEENKKLRLEIATLKSYARIEKFATGELGMFKPRADQVIVIR